MRTFFAGGNGLLGTLIKTLFQMTDFCSKITAKLSNYLLGLHSFLYSLQNVLEILSRCNGKEYSALFNTLFLNKIS